MSSSRHPGVTIWNDWSIGGYSPLPGPGREGPSLRAKLVAVIGVAILVLVVGSLGVASIRQYRGAVALVDHTREVQGVLSRLLQRLTDAETGERGYLLTGTEEFLQPYRTAARDVADGVSTLRTLTGDNPAQQGRLDSLATAVAVRLDSLAHGIDTRRQRAETSSLAQLQSGKALMDTVRTLVSEMDAEESALLIARYADQNRRGTIATWVIMLGSVASFALLLLIVTAIRRDVALREAARRRIEEQNIELETQASVLADQQLELEHQLEESQVIGEELTSANTELLALTADAERARAVAERAVDSLRASEQRYRFLADTIPVQVWTATPDGQLDFVNQRVVDYFGRTREEVLGDGWLRVLHPDDVASVAERWTHAVTTGEPYEVNFRLRRASDDSYRWHLGRALALRDGSAGVAAWFGSNTDIDDQHRAQDERERLVHALERSNQELDQFAYVASHDLKAPLRGIANLSEWIEEDMGSAFPSDAREKMDLLRGRVRRLEGLIDGILEYSRAGRAQTTVGPVDVRALVTEVIELLAPSASVRIDVQPALPTVVSERVPLSQVFSNLIGNAIKYGQRTDAVIGVYAADEGAFVRFSIADNGPGIDHAVSRSYLCRLPDAGRP